MSKIGFWILLTKFLATLNCDAQTIENEFNSEKLLSRHRRYLVFPEGSSLQLVYDQIIGMVGSTNLHIFGITCALAWQLPHELHKHPIEEHHDKTINLSSANKTTQRIDIPLKRIDFNHFTTYYNRKNYHNHQMNNSYYDYLWAKTKPEKLNRYYFGSNAKERWNYKHQIYPAPRMRRNIHSDKIHPEIKYFLKYHRNTRFDLYNSIEKYLNGNGVDGEQCIKRAICETTQFEIDNTIDENTPKDFVKEILRVIFSLPSQQFHRNEHVERNKYDAVLNDVDTMANIDCSIKFPNCPTSIWSEQFIF